jgi:hypothetical protein
MIVEAGEIGIATSVTSAYMVSVCRVKNAEVRRVNDTITYTKRSTTTSLTWMVNIIQSLSKHTDRNTIV